MKLLSMSSIGRAVCAVLLSAGYAYADVPAPIPEPATMSLLAAGAGMYLLHRRRK